MYCILTWEETGVETEQELQQFKEINTLLIKAISV